MFSRERACGGCRIDSLPTLWQVIGMNATISLDNFNRLPVSRALRATAGFKRKQPLRAVAMPGKIIIEAMPRRRQADPAQGPHGLDR